MGGKEVHTHPAVEGKEVHTHPTVEGKEVHTHSPCCGGEGGTFGTDFVDCFLVTEEIPVFLALDADSGEGEVDDSLEDNEDCIPFKEETGGDPFFFTAVTRRSKCSH